MSEHMERPIDQITSGLMHGATQAGCGWLLDAARDEEGRFGVKFAVELPPVDTYEPPPSWRQHKFDTPQALTAYAKRYGTADNSVVFFTDTQIQLVLDEKVGPEATGEREVLTCDWNYAGDFTEWKANIGKAHEYAALRTSLPMIAHTLEDPALLIALREIRYTETTKYDSEIKENGDKSYGIVFEVKGHGEKLHPIPKEFKIRVPVLDVDVLDPTMWEVFNVKVEVQMPDKPGGGLHIILISPEIEQKRRARLAKEMADIRMELGDDWLIVAGEFSEKTRKIGNAERFKPIKPPTLTVVGPAPQTGSAR